MCKLAGKMLEEWGEGQAPHLLVQWRTGQGVSLPDGKWAPLNIRQYVKNVNDFLVA
jgi:hypothetical protein